MLKNYIPQGHDIPLPVTQSSTTDHPCEQGQIIIMERQFSLPKLYQNNYGDYDNYGDDDVDWTLCTTCTKTLSCSAPTCTSCSAPTKF